MKSKPQTIAMNCPFCDNRESTQTSYPVNRFNNKEFRNLRCTRCKLIYLSQTPTPEDYSLMYPPSYQGSIVQTDILADMYKKLPGLRFSYGYQFDRIRQYASGKEITVLDYGCGTGHFMANAVASGIPCDGAEFNSEYVKMLSASLRDSAVYTIDDILGGRVSKKYDVIRMSNVLEHLDSPMSILRILSAQLTPGGFFLIEGPIEENFSLAWLFRKTYFRIGHWINPRKVVSAPPYHIWFSDATNQRELFRKTGLSELHFKTTEAPWPLPARLSDARGIFQVIGFFVAQLSIALTKVLPGKMGNTFIYIGKDANTSNG